MAVYYNEIDEFAVEWLRELIRRKALPDGEVDTRSIVDVRPDDLRGFVQCHFFAGIGGWAYALRLAGWPDDRECWTGSCPCQPWSVAGSGAGADDPRHLWPAWFPLIRERRPPTVFGEQVASKDGEYWLDLVLADLEGIDYAVGALDLPVACVGAPGRRQRLWIVADDHRARREAFQAPRLHADRQPGVDAVRRGADGDEPWVLADTDKWRQRTGHRDTAVKGITDEVAGTTVAGGCELDETTAPGDVAHSSRGGLGTDRRAPGRAGHAHKRSEADGVGDTIGPRLEGLAGDGDDRDEPGWFGTESARPAPSAGPTSGFWFPADWLPCSDGKARPVEPGTFPLADGVSARVGRLRGYGNAIVPQLAAEVIGAYLEISDGVC